MAGCLQKPEAFLHYYTRTNADLRAATLASQKYFGDFMVINDEFVYYSDVLVAKFRKYELDFLTIPNEMYMIGLEMKRNTDDTYYGWTSMFFN